MYSSFDPEHEIAFSVAVAFETGEVWSADTHLLSNKTEIYLEEVAKELVTRLPQYAAFLNRLQIPEPYRWIAGLDDLNHMP